MPPTEATGAVARLGPRTPLDVFLRFNRMALQGFGGVLAVAQVELVERAGWLTREEFVESLAISQVLPGPNVCNLSLMVGDRFFGWRGALAALGGMMAVPLLIVLALAALYSHWQAVPAVSGALRGMGAVAAGLVVATALKLAWALRASPLGRSMCIALGGATFAAVIVWRVPLVWVVCGTGPVGIAVAWWKLR